ncbi:MAG TPA: outer membrane protein assembly factor BamB [Acidiferrobacterales bacterium]|nr:outer membrane protein assembly factor BamB [Acidiferrobacterales bacterium]
MMRKAGPLALALALGGCSWFGGPDVEQPAVLVEFEPSAAITQVWSVDIGTGPDRQFLRLGPARHEDTIYTVDVKGRVHALAQQDGKERWRTDLDLAITGGVGFGDDLVLVASRKGAVVALDKSKGQELWRAQVASEVLAPPAADAGVVVVQSVDGKLTGLASANGKRLWTFDRSEPALSLRGTAIPVILSDAVLTGFASGKIVAVNLKNGRLLWETPVAQPQGRSEIERLIDVDVPVLVSGRTLLAAAYQGKIVAVNLESGRLLWSRDISTYSALAADSSNVYVSDVRGHVYALDLQSGSTVWKQDKLALRRLSAPTVTGNAVAVADFEGYVHWLAREDGRFLARERAARAAVLAAPIADGATLYVNTQNGYLAALRLGTRTP